MDMYIYNLDYVRECNLYNNKGTSPINVTLKNIINEVAELTFSVPYDNPMISYVINCNYIEFENQIYEIVKVTATHDEEEKKFIDVICEHYCWSLSGKKIVETETLDPLLPTEALEFLLYEGATPRYGWTLGTITAPEVYRGFAFTDQSVFEGLIQLAEIYNSYYEFDARIVNGAMLAVVNFYDKDDIGGFEPVRIEVNNNLKDVSVVYDTSEMATRMYCFGGTDPSTGIEVDLFDAIVEGVPYAKTYVENYDYYLEQGYTQQYILNNPNIFLKETVWRDSNYVDAATLYADAVKKLEVISRPKLTVTFNAIDFRDYDYGLRGAKVGYPVFVRDEDIGIYVQCIITSISRNYEQPWLYNIEVSNAIDYNNILRSILGGVNATNITINQNGTVKPDALGTALDSIRAELADLIANAENDGLTDDEQERIDAIRDVLFPDGGESMYAFAKRSRTPIDNKSYWQMGIIASQFNADSTSIAVQKTGLEPERIYVAYCDARNGFIEYAPITHPVANIGFTEVQTLTDCAKVIVAFDGTFAYNTFRQIEFFTEDIPWVFYINSAGALYGMQLNGTPIILAESNATDLTATRGFRSVLGEYDTGLVLFFILNGDIYYRQYIDGVWEDGLPINFGPDVTWVRINASFTFDYRICIQAEDSDGNLYEIFTTFDGIAKKNFEHIEITDITATGQLLAVSYYDFQDGAENIEIANISAGGQLLWAVDTNMISASNIDNGSGDYGYKVRIIWDHVIDILTGNNTAFQLIDSESHVFNSISVSQIDGDEIEVAFQNFNNAVGNCDVTYIAGTIIGEAGQVLDNSTIQFTPTNLVPFAIDPPAPLSMVITSDWSLI